MEENSLTIRPYNDQHAIKTMAFVVELEKEITQEGFKRSSILEKKLKDELPRLVSHKAVTFNLGGEGSGASKFHADETPGGFTLDRLMTNGTQEWALSLQTNFVRVLCNKYERWDGTWSKARSYFHEALPLVLEDNRVRAITLQYIDEFSIDGDFSKFKTDELFRKQSPYLVPIVFESNNLWHSHSGMFSYTAQGHRLLNVVNVSLVAQDDGIKAQIVMTHKLDNESGEPLFSNEKFGPAIHDLMAFLHEHDKEILSKVITDKYIDLIGLVVRS